MTTPNQVIRRNKITYIASQEGVQRAVRALRRLGFESRSNFAESQRISRSTVTKFFRCEPIQLDSFKRICEALQLCWKEIAEISVEQSGRFAINDFSSQNTSNHPEQIQQVRQVTVIDNLDQKVITLIILKGDINSVQNFKIIQSILQEYSGTTIKIVDIQRGSIKLVVDGSQEEIKRLVSRIKSGEVKELNGYPIVDVQNLSEASDSKWFRVQQIITQAVEGRNLSDVDLSDVDLHLANLSGADLSKADLSNADLTNVNLFSANLNGADLNGADLRRADLRCADLRRADLRRADLRDADLRDADLRGTNLSGANLSNTKLSGSLLAGVNLSDVDLTGVNLSDVDLTGVNLSDVYITHANQNTNKVGRSRLKIFLLGIILGFVFGLSISYIQSTIFFPSKNIPSQSTLDIPSQPSSKDIQGSPPKQVELDHCGFENCHLDEESKPKKSSKTGGEIFVGDFISKFGNDRAKIIISAFSGAITSILIAKWVHKKQKG